VKPLSISVAIAAASALLAGITKGGGDVLGFAADPTLLSIGAVGLMLALTTFRSALISPFLRVFSTIFAVEYVVTELAYVVVWAGWWPPSLSEAAPPASLPTTIAIFGLLVHLISFIPVIRQITRLADPYFMTDDRGDLEIGGFGARHVTERRFASSLVVALVVINQLQVAINIRLSFFNRDWFNAIQNKDSAAFWSLLFGVFCFWAAIAVVSSLVEYYTESVLKIRWRRWMTERYYGLWLDDGSLYRAALVGQAADNPDQRIAEDVRNFLNSTYAYSISLLSTVSTLVSFSIILWTLPVDFNIPQAHITVPGLPFWVALVYSLVGTWLTHLIGKPLVQLEFSRERYEADFRFALARVREYSEQVALLRGEKAERRILGGRFGSIVSNFYAIVGRTVKLLTFTTAYFQANVVIPYLIVAPYFFLGKITLGQMTQTAGAFGRVEAALTFFIARYQSLASYKAVVERLTTFRSAIDEARRLGTKPPRIERTEHFGRDLALRDLVLCLPDGREIVCVDRLTIEAGTTTLVSGPSGSGKSTLFRAISGIWPYGRGTIDRPADATIMLLPQRPYIPSGTLKTAVAYPSVAGAYDDEALRHALELARLASLACEIDGEDNWPQRLSGGEQQRLAIARAILEKPDWLFLDEATSALDEELEAEIYRMLSEVLPNTTIVSIGHRSTLIALHRRHIEMKPGQGGIFEPTPKLPTATDSLAAETGFDPSVPDHKTAGHLTERQSSQAISKP
jgi:vitamin B12/bleomycin/antimicrobial peptide transport system ATP-binding/permease protein